MMVKVAFDAGHGLHTAGKRCLKSLDSNETREWTLNDRVVDKCIKKLEGYEGVSVIRVDDPTGAVDISLGERCRRANDWGADIYVSIHHNAGINGGKGGGIVVYRYPTSKQFTNDMSSKLYNKLIAKTGLRGNRSKPLDTANFYVLRKTRMASVLVEHGFMDSASDIGYILSDRFAEQCAEAHVEFLAEQYGLKKKPDSIQPVKPSGGNTGWRVCVGYYEDYNNAKRAVEQAKAKGFSAYMVEYKK